jgi:hypothetical protein
VLLFSSYLSIWKFLTLLHHFRNHIHFLNTYRGPCTQSGKGTLERISVSIPQCQGDQLKEYYLDTFLCLHPCEKYPCLQGQTKTKLLTEMWVTYSCFYHIYGNRGNIALHIASIKENIMKIDYSLWFCNKSVIWHYQQA